MTVDQLPDWWVNSSLYATLRGHMGVIPLWNYACAMAIVVLTHLQFRKTPVDKRLRPGVLTGLMLFVTGLCMFLGVAMTDGGTSLYYGSAFWAVTVILYACFMLVWRIHLRRTAAGRALPQRAAANHNLRPLETP